MKKSQNSQVHSDDLMSWMSREKWRSKWLVSCLEKKYLEFLAEDDGCNEGGARSVGAVDGEVSGAVNVAVGEGREVGPFGPLGPCSEVFTRSVGGAALGIAEESMKLILKEDLSFFSLIKISEKEVLGFFMGIGRKEVGCEGVLEVLEGEDEIFVIAMSSLISP